MSATRCPKLLRALQHRKPLPISRADLATMRRLLALAHAQRMFK